MNKKIIWIVVLFAFIFSLIVVHNFLNSRSKNNQNIGAISNTEGNSKIKTVNINNFESEVLNNEKITLIDFYADWCPPCKMLSPLVEKIAEERDDINFVKVNIDYDVELANKYGVVSIPTLVVIKDGKEVDRSIGYIEKEKIEELLKH